MNWMQVEEYLRRDARAVLPLGSTEQHSHLPLTWAKVQAIDPVASHGSWMENFPWTRLPTVVVPATQRPMVDLARVRALDPVALRAYLGDGNYGGLYQRSDEDMLTLWQVAVEETRAVLA